MKKKITRFFFLQTVQISYIVIMSEAFVKQWNSTENKAVSCTTKILVADLSHYGSSNKTMDFDT